jgi:hypothetical protein
MFGVANKRVNIDTIGEKCGATETMKGESIQLLQQIALKGPPVRLCGTVRMDLDQFFWIWSAEYHSQIRYGTPLWYRVTAARNLQ